MNNIVVRGAQLLAAFALAGCFSIDIGKSGRASGQYRLAGNDTVAQAAPARAAKTDARALLVAPLAGSSVDDSFALAYARSTQARAPYQFATWSERPSSQLAQMLVERLAARRSFASVALLGRGVAGDLQLNLVVVDFYHDVPSASARVRIDVELVDRASRQLIGRRAFEATAPVPQANAAGAAAALDTASNQALDALIAWLEAGMPTPAAPAGTVRPAA